MRQLGTYGDDREVTAMAKLYGRLIVIHQLDGNKYTRMYKDLGHQATGDAPVWHFVYYKHREHYNVLTPPITSTHVSNDGGRHG